MLKLSIEDKKEIDNSYKLFLYNLKFVFENTKINSALDCYKILNEMFQTGQFCMEKTIKIDDNFKYLSLPNMEFLGTQVMYGTCCCRHASALINDILQVLGLNSSLLYIFIDEFGNWHQQSLINANHVTILLKDDGCEYILDPANNFILKKQDDKSLVSFSVETSSLDMSQFSNYSDHNISNIGIVLKKYYNLQSIGINHIYDYNF